MKKPDAARRKLVDWIGPRKEDGALRAIVATTYEFQQDFFETDFLPNVLDLGAWKERHWTSRIALERKLSDLKVAAIFLDAACYRGRPDSLRVSVNPVALGRGRSLHAKVLLLVYEDAVRLILGSANLTEKGYRKNREGVIALRCAPDAVSQAPLVREGIAGLRQLVTTWPKSGAGELLDDVDSRIARWTAGANASPTHESLVWSDQARPLWRSFVDAWPRGQRIRRVSLLSPFWSDEGSTGPLAMFLERLRERAEIAADAEVHLLTEAFPTSRDAFMPVFPEGFAAFDARTLGIKAFVSPVDPRIDPREVDIEDFDGHRDLHAKAVLVEGDSDALAYVGSANFTRRGWGLRSTSTGGAQNANLEAGLLLRRPASDAFRKQILPDTVGPPIPLDGKAAGKFKKLEASTADQAWPAFITDIVLAPREDDTRELELQVTHSATAEDAWSVQVPADATTPAMPLCSSSDVGDAVIISVALTSQVLERIVLEREVEVVWGLPARAVRFPVNVDLAARDGLPVAPGSVRPGESLLLAYYQGKVAWEEMYPEPGATRDADAPGAVAAQMVDTTRIQSYQIREFVEALRGIRDDLGTAAQSGSAMSLALRGPVSPLALAKVVDEAVRKHGRTPVAACFQLVEILAVLRDATTFAAPKYQNEWQTLLSSAREEVELLLTRLKTDHPAPFAAGGAFARYEDAIEKKRAVREEAP